MARMSRRNRPAGRTSHRWAERRRPWLQVVLLGLALALLSVGAIALNHLAPRASGSHGPLATSSGSIRSPSPTFSTSPSTVSLPQAGCRKDPFANVYLWGSKTPITFVTCGFSRAGRHWIGTNRLHRLGPAGQRRRDVRASRRVPDRYEPGFGGDRRP